jgi:methyl-accepting chemotaxis protein
MNRLSLKVRLFLLVAIPLVLFVAASLFLIRLNNSNTAELASSLYETTDKSTSLILNADRDMYQALTAYQLLVSGSLNAAEITARTKDYQDNIEQAKQRVNQAKDILQSKSLLDLIHQGNKQTIQQNFDNFNTFFDQWAKDSSQAVQSKTSQINEPKLMNTFEKGRSGLNTVGEILDSYAKDSIDQITAKNHKTAWIISSVIGVLILLISVIGYVVIRQIMVTVKRIVTITRGVAGGNLCYEAQIKYAADELGQISEAVDVMIGKIKGLIGTIAENTQLVQSASREMTDSSKESATAAEHVAENIQEVTHDVEIQTRSTEEASRAIEEMAVGIQRVAENTGIMAEHSSLTSQHAELGNEHLHKLKKQMADILASIMRLSQTVQSLTRKSDQIGRIASSITDFANQTNLLSLNASIEAARAGEHGRGFSVVSNEIRKLAAQSIQSADGINRLIQETRLEISSVSDSMNVTMHEANEGSSLMNEVTQSFETIVESVQQIVSQIHETSAITEQMSASSQQISATMDQSATTTNQIFDKTQGVAAATEEQLALIENIAAAAEQLTDVVNTLNESVAYFKIA